MMDQPGNDILDAYRQAVNLNVVVERGKFPKRWIAIIHDDPCYFVAEKGFLTKRSALNFVERTVLEYTDEFWS